VPEIPKQNIQSEKCLVSMIWGGTWIKSLLYLPKDMKYNTTFFVESVVPDLVEHICQESRGKTLPGIMDHLDNTRPTTAKVGQLLLQQKPVESTSYSLPDELISAIGELLASFPKDQLVTVYNNWMKRQNLVIKHHGEYYRN
jgi:hypothetical protein